MTKVVASPAPAYETSLTTQSRSSPHGGNQREPAPGFDLPLPSQAPSLRTL